MRAHVIAVTGLLSVIAILPDARAAECSLFAAADACSAAKPKVEIRLAPRALIAVSPPQVASPAGTDCKMLKPVDPQFNSAMPVVRPDSAKQLPMPIIQVPSCKR
jgi:hypothetical protein